MVVGTFCGHQLRVSARFNYFSIVDDSNAVGVVDSGETVSNDDAGPALPGLVQSLLHYLLTLRVQGRGGLVQEEEFGVPYESSGDGDALLLTPGELSSLAPYICTVALEMKRET